MSSHAVDAVLGSGTSWESRIWNVRESISGSMTHKCKRGDRVLVKSIGLSDLDYLSVLLDSIVLCGVVVFLFRASNLRLPLHLNVK